MTMPYDPAELTIGTRRLATLLLAAGLDPQRCLLFVQSHVRAHAELTWLLNCTATFGELRRMTQFKEKSPRRRQESVSVGLFDYPVLMASDILLYDTDEVPVGDDQRQHVELTRDIAVRFNHQFGDVFTVPKATFPPVGARIMDLQEPTRKMSKSEESPQGTIGVLDDPKAIAKKIKSAVTDSDTDVRHDRDAKPGVSNLIEIHAAVTGQTIASVEQAVRRRRLRAVQGGGRRRRGRVPPARAGALRRAHGRSRRGRPAASRRRRRRDEHRRPGARPRDGRGRAPPEGLDC